MHLINIKALTTASMFIAIDSNNERIAAVKGVEAFCPACKGQVIAKIGKLVSRHWAHKKKCGCDHGKGMTPWHYRWIERHYKKPNWEVEWSSGGFRFDCFNSDTKTVLEIQKKPIYEYIIEKSEYILSQGYSVNWILHESMFKSLKQKPSVFQAISRRRLVILDILKMFSDRPNVEFYLDSHADASKGNSSKGLLHLLPLAKTEASYSDYYRIPYHEHKF